MPTTVQFFNCFLSKNGARTNVSISDFLDGVISLEESVRFRENRYGSFSLIDMFMPTENPNDNTLDRIVGFANYRDKKPFVGTRGRDERNEITGDVLELTTCMFIPTYHLAIIEYNHFGARPMHIEQYLNSFLPTRDGNDWVLELIPIETPASFREIRGSGDIRNIEIKLDLLSNDVNLFTDEGNDPQSISYRILHGSYQAYKDIGANVATLSLGQGRYKSNPMEFESLISLLQVLDLQSDIFASVKVKYFNPNTRKLTTADLKNDGLLKKVIMENNNSTAFESVGVGISEYYYEQSNRLANSEWRTHVTELIAAELPLIRPREHDENTD